MKPQIVFVDAATLDLGDVDLTPLKESGILKTYENTSQAQLFKRCEKAQIIIANKFIFDESILSRLPSLQFLCICATGVNNVDLEACKRRNIGVSNVKGYSTQSVAEHALLFLLAFSHRLLEHHRASVGKRWSRSPHFTLLDYPFSNLCGSTLGIVGYGAIGKKVAQMAKHLGMKVLVAKIPGLAYAQGSKRLPLKEVFQKSDYITLHCPQTPLTKCLINSKTLSFMGPSTTLLNLARGPLVDEMAVYHALKNGQLAGYATDVLTQEPPPSNHPLFDPKLKDKVLITPHVAWASRESRQKLIDEIALNIEAFKKKKKRNRIV